MKLSQANDIAQITQAGTNTTTFWQGQLIMSKVLLKGVIIVIIVLAIILPCLISCIRQSLQKSLQGVWIAQKQKEGYVGILKDFLLGNQHVSNPAYEQDWQSLSVGKDVMRR